MQSKHWLKSSSFLSWRGGHSSTTKEFSSFLKVSVCILLFCIRSQSQTTALQLDFKCVYSFFSRAYLLMSFLHVSPIVCLLPSYPSMLGALCGQPHSFTFVPTDCHTFTCGGHLINTPYAFFTYFMSSVHIFILKGHASQKKPWRIL